MGTQGTQENAWKHMGTRGHGGDIWAYMGPMGHLETHGDTRGYMGTYADT